MTKSEIRWSPKLSAAVVTLITLVGVASVRCLGLQLEASGMLSGLYEDAPVGGRLTQEEGWRLSENLLMNPNFTKSLQGWNADTNCFAVDETVRSPRGFPSLRLSNPDKCSKDYPIAQNDFVANEGVYDLGGYIKTKDISCSSGGVEIYLFGLGAGPTPTLCGTHDWTKRELKDAAVPAGKRYPFWLNTQGRPSGTAWFADLWLRKHLPPPLSAFLLYPNYRGLVFDDRSQRIRLLVQVNGTASSQAKTVVVEVAEANSGSVAIESTYPLQPRFIAELDVGALPHGRYLVRARLVDSHGKEVFAQSPYLIVKVPSSFRKRLKAWIDPDNVAHFGGRRRFVMGIYDTTGYSGLASFWDREFKPLAEARLNAYINYWITLAGFDILDVMTHELNRYGMYYLATVNNFYPSNIKEFKLLLKGFGGNNADELIANYSRGVSRNSGIIGYYVQDEPPTELVESTFHQYRIIRANDPGSLTFAVLNRPAAFGLWRDAVDVIGTDPYPLYGPPPNDLSLVGDWTRQAIDAVHGSRPVWTVIQFFQATAASHWPTQQELHDMSWMAIIEGATGLFYWSYGEGALAWEKDPARREALWRELVTVTQGVVQMEPVLISPDVPVVSKQGISSAAIRVKSKNVNGIRYLMAYNHSGEPVEASIRLNQDARRVEVYQESRVLPVEGTTFSDRFAPYQAHVYIIR